MFGFCTVVSHLSYSPYIHDMTVQVLIMSFNLLLSLPIVLLSPPTPTNTQICSRHYAVVAEVPMVS